MSTCPNQLEHKIKITYVQSPINQISQEFISEKLQAREPAPPLIGNQRFKQISERLETNIRKIEKIEGKYQNKQTMNFKMLRNNLIQGTLPKNQGPKTHQSSNQNNNQSRNSIYQRVHPNQRQTQARRQLICENSSPNKIECRSSNKSLQECLKQIHQLKNTVKALKKGCIKGSQHEKTSKMMNGSSIDHQFPYQSDQKYKPSSGSKYSYTNYRNISHKKSSLSQDRFIYSDRKFNWLKNPNIREFTIEVEGSQTFE